MGRDFVAGADASVATASSTKDFLKAISKDIAQRMPIIVWYGPPGAGKTSFGSQFRECLFMIDNQETGIQTLKANGIVKGDIPVLPIMDNWEDVIACLKEIVAADIPYKTLVIDTLGGMERLCHNYCRERDFKGNNGKFVAFAAGNRTSLPYWNEFLGLLDQIRDKGITILALAHSEVRNTRNPQGDDYDIWQPSLSKESMIAVTKWADSVIFVSPAIELDDDAKGTKAKAKGGFALEAHCQPDAAYVAKNRMNLPFKIDLGDSAESAFQEFTQAVVEGRKSNG